MYKLVEDPTEVGAEWGLKEIVYKDVVKSKDVVVAGLMPACEDQYGAKKDMSIELKKSQGR